MTLFIGIRIDDLLILSHLNLEELDAESLLTFGVFFISYDVCIAGQGLAKFPYVENGPSLVLITTFLY